MVALAWCLVPSIKYAQAQTVYAQDTIVIGSGCVGSDCTTQSLNAANPVVLSENNTRFAFSDGNAIMRMTANGNASSGGSYFAIDLKETFAFSDVPVLANAVYTPVAIGGDGRAQVLMPANYERLLVGPVPNSTDIETTSPTPSSETYFFVPQGSYRFIGSDILVTRAVQIEDEAGQPILASGTSLGYRNALSISADGNDITLGRNANVVTGAVSIGSSGAESRIHHVAAGTEASDIINVAQLSAFTAVGEFQALEIDNLNAQATGMAAIATAMSAMQINPRHAGGMSYSVGLGYYDGVAAGAFGVVYPVNDGFSFRFAVVDSSQNSPQTALQGSLRW